MSSVSLFPTQPVRSILKRPRLAGVQSNVRFDRVAVFSFPRCQGFTSVPSHGGATLGMMRRHSTLNRYTVAEHALEQRQRRRERLRERLTEDRSEALKHKVSALHVYISWNCWSALRFVSLYLFVGPSLSPAGPWTREKQKRSQRIASRMKTPTSTSVMLSWTTEVSFSRTPPGSGRLSSWQRG